MELSLVSLYKFSCKDPSTILKSKQQPNRFVVFGCDTFIFELKNYPDSLEHINFQFQYGITLKEYPISEIIKNNDMLSIYNKATVLEKQSITLDHLYASEFTEVPLEIRNINYCWPDPGNYLHIMDAPVATLTNFGQLDIYSKNLITHDWEIFKFNINKILREIFHQSNQSPKKNFKELKIIVDNYFITCCCWEPIFDKKSNKLPRDESLLFCSTASGWILGINVMKNEAKFEFKLKTDLYKINCLETYRIQDDNSIYLIASDINGLIKIFQIERHDNIMKELCCLWTKVDKLSCNCFHINYCRGKIVIATAKGSNFLAFLINSKNELVDTKYLYCGAVITGFDKASLLNEYIITTKNGIIKYAKIKVQSERSIEIKTKNIKHDLLELENYQVIGLLSTPNFVGWIFILIPRIIYANDANIKHPLVLSFHQFNKLEPLSILEAHESYNMHDFIDCNEIIRVKIQRNQYIDNYYKYNIGPIEISKDFLHRLRIRSMIAYSISGYNLKKMKNRGQDYQAETCDIQRLIKSLASYFRINFLIMSCNDFTDFQKLTVKCARKNLIKYLESENELNEYSAIRDTLEQDYKNLIDQTESLVKFTEEHCNYCKRNIDSTNTECVHNFLQCCVSFVQIQTLEMMHCERCKAVALNNEDQLYEILDENEEILCPYCNYILLNSDICS